MMLIGNEFWYVGWQCEREITKMKKPLQYRDGGGVVRVSYTQKI